MEILEPLILIAFGLYEIAYDIYEIIHISEGIGFCDSKTGILVILSIFLIFGFSLFIMSTTIAFFRYVKKVRLQKLYSWGFILSSLLMLAKSAFTIWFFFEYGSELKMQIFQIVYAVFALYFFIREFRKFKEEGIPEIQERFKGKLRLVYLAVFALVVATVVAYWVAAGGDCWNKIVFECEFQNSTHIKTEHCYSCISGNETSSWKVNHDKGSDDLDVSVFGDSSCGVENQTIAMTCNSFQSISNFVLYYDCAE